MLQVKFSFFDVIKLLKSDLLLMSIPGMPVHGISVSPLAWVHTTILLGSYWPSCCPGWGVSGGPVLDDACWRSWKHSLDAEHGLYLDSENKNNKSSSQRAQSSDLRILIDQKNLKLEHKSVTGLCSSVCPFRNYVLSFNPECYKLYGIYEQKNNNYSWLSSAFHKCLRVNLILQDYKSF